MKKINDSEMMDYVDGTLDAARVVAVEEYLQSNAEDAQLVADMKLAMASLREWDEAEPVHVAPDFWPRLRDKLPDKPQRSWLRRTAAHFSSWAAPLHSPWRASVPVAVIVVFIAMAAFLLGPKDSTRSSVATPLSPAEKTFIQQSLDRHAVYDSAQPLSSSIPVVVGDGSSAEHGDEDDDDSDHQP
ncbi:MAG TPA: hypothetical protein VNA16_01925 [Abditibacteriaceae bacterium]|nr:hypothetical protein [Abditibacteriaceae bacterium]